MLALPYEHFSDRRLSELMACATGKETARVLNDIHARAGGTPGAAATGAVEELLERPGLQAVCAEDRYRAD